MIKSVKCGIAAAVVFAAGFAAFQSFGAYGVQDNSLLMQNIEALAQGPDGGDGDNGDGNSGGRRFDPIKCHLSPATKGVHNLICPEGTTRDVFSYCPTESGIVNAFSATSFCLRELSN